jgi:HD-GYP domain-containing protein (c-di-GMP phosphodiesterase class II)
MPTAVAAKYHAANPLFGYVSVRLNTLHSVKAAVVDLFVQFEPHSPPVLYDRAGCNLDPQHIAELADAGIENVYVRNNDFDRFGGDLLESIESYLHREGVSQTEKFSALQVAVAVEIEHSLRMVDCGRIHSLAEKIGRQLVGLLAASDVLPRDLFRIARHDFSTFTHITNVASYSVILAESLGVRDHQELEQIAAGALLHDIGKRFIPTAILNKPGRLDPEEREICESHPKRGYVELCDRPGLNFGQLMMVYQHHERIDGTGYPVRILGDEIHPWAKLLAVVDVFEAMTASRPYRRPDSAESVLAYQRRHAGTHFDREVVECWISAMTKE